MTDHPTNCLEPPVRPPNFNVTPSSIAEATERVITTTRNLVNELCIPKNAQEFTFTNTILPFLHDENIRLRESRFIYFYKSSNPDKDLRDASHDATLRFDDFEVELYGNKDFCKAVMAVKARGEKMDPEYAQYLNYMLMAFEKSGCSLENVASRDRFTQLSTEFNAKTAQAFKNLDEDETGIWIARDELEGLPPNFFEKRKSETTGLGEAGRFWISGRFTDVEPVVKYAINPDVRKRVYLMRHHVSPGNISLYKEIIIIRDEKARLLGYQNHASFMLSTRTKMTPESVISDLKNLEASLKPQKDAELALLTNLKQEDLKGSGKQEPLYLWDYPYYSRIQVEQALQVSNKDVAEYFPFEHCLSSLLRMFEKLFTIHIESFCPAEGETWHTDVKVYAVWEIIEGRKYFLGWLYIDPYPRANKYRHFGHCCLQQACTSITGERMSAASVLMINFPPPTENKPTLLSHEYLRRLFHELGHAMHSLLSKTKCSRFHGPPRINRDFAEAVSIMFENFLWIPEIMSDVSLHYSYLDSRYREAWMAENMNAQQPPRQMKKELIQSIVDGRSAGEVGRIITIIFQSLFDLAIHTAATSEDIKNLDLQSLWNSSIVEITGRTGPDEDHGDMHRWGHGFSGFRAPVSGYDAGYFTYVLSRVVSFDLFESGFKSDPLSPVLGARYREIILQPGGSKDVDDIVLEFLGREVSDAAFKNSMGL